MTSAAPELLLSFPVDHVALVTLNRPEARNAVNPAAAEQLEAIVDLTEAREDIWVVVLTGAGGKAFCAGADLKEISKGNLPLLMRDRGGFAGFVNAARTKPWIAAVEGAAMAGGCEIALACDMIVASEISTFALPEVKRGLVAAAGGLYRLPRAIPRSVALEMILTGGAVSAATLTGFGLVNHIVPAGEASTRALELASAICANAPLAVRESLAIARHATAIDETGLQAESDAAQDRLAQTEDFREGPLAFVEKRAPHWTGR